MTECKSHYPPFTKFVQIAVLRMDMKEVQGKKEFVPIFGLSDCACVSMIVMCSFWSCRIPVNVLQKYIQYEFEMYYALNSGPRNVQYV
jgi:hypothetical protein